MLKAFQSYIIKNELNSAGATTLIGVSGGRDSVVLCDLYYKAGLKFAIAHCNFNLRGKESDEDEAFVINLAKNYHVKLHKKSCDTKVYAKENGISIQMAARDLRFKWFKELLQENKYSAYATAHHQDDAIETYLINQIRGTGIAGLHGILPKLGQLVHPLLFATREDIDQYIKQENISFREDSSNTSTKYLRNKVRHDLIPLLAEINPQIHKILLNNMVRISSAEKILKLKIDEIRKEFCTISDTDFRIQMSTFKNLDFAPTLLYELIKDFGFNYSQARQVLEIDEETISGSLYYSPSHRMLRDRESLIIEENKKINKEYFEITKETFSIDSPIYLSFEIIKDRTILQDSNIAQLDYHKLKFPLQIRKWQKGDYFYPLGMKGRKKLLSDYFIDQKLSLFEKENVWLLCSDENIVWIIGFRMDDRFKLSGKSEEVYKVCFRD